MVNYDTLRQCLNFSGHMFDIHLCSASHDLQGVHWRCCTGLVILFMFLLFSMFCFLLCLFYAARFSLTIPQWRLCAVPSEPVSDVSIIDLIVSDEPVWNIIPHMLLPSDVTVAATFHSFQTTLPSVSLWSVLSSVRIYMQFYCRHVHTERAHCSSLILICRWKGCYILIIVRCAWFIALLAKSDGFY